MKTSKELYLDWFNNFLTVEKFAEHYDMHPILARKLITQGRKEHERECNLLPNGIPRYVKIFENPEYLCCYDIYFTKKRYKGGKGNYGFAFEANNTCIGQWFEYQATPKTKNTVDFRNLPEWLQKVIVSEYKDIWKIK